MNNQKSMLETAYEALRDAGSGMSFKELYEKVVSTLGMSQEESDERIGDFYADITLDGRFTLVKDGAFWDLRSRHNYDACKKDPRAFYEAVNTDSGDVEEKENEEAEENGGKPEEGESEEFQGDDFGDKVNDDQY